MGLVEASEFSVTGDGRICATFKSSHDSYEQVLLGLRGRHQVDNATMAIELAESLRERGFEISNSAVREGLKNARHSGRLELIEGQPAILLDGAHNPAGAQALRAYLEEFVREPITLVFGAMRDKGLSEMSRLLFPCARLIVYCTWQRQAASVERCRRRRRPSMASGPPCEPSAAALAVALKSTDPAVSYALPGRSIWWEKFARLSARVTFAKRARRH